MQATYRALVHATSIHGEYYRRQFCYNAPLVATEHEMRVSAENQAAAKLGDGWLISVELLGDESEIINFDDDDIVIFPEDHLAKRPSRIGAWFAAYGIFLFALTIGTLCYQCYSLRTENIDLRQQNAALMESIGWDGTDPFVTVEEWEI